MQLLRQRSLGVLIGSLGTVTFDLAVLGVCFLAFGYSPPLGVIALGYLIGQLGGNIPVPGGIGGLELGLIGTFALYHQPTATTTAAVLVYHAVALWVPGVLGSVVFVQLRRTLQHDERPAATCLPLGRANPGRPRQSGSPKSIAHPSASAQWPMPTSSGRDTSSRAHLKELEPFAVRTRCHPRRMSPASTLSPLRQ